ncbi:hypothetical protein [Lactobacillus sp. PSON]|uniref:hypothetical protein n=1 Tax=Lactobacillus sp. PSON TaxID=3455454 RepID=UPI0040420652
MKFKKLLISAILLTSSVTALSVVSMPANAATTKTASVTIKNSPLTKDGYLVKVTNDISGKVYVGATNYKKQLKSVTPLKHAKTVSPKNLKKIKFRIEKVATMKGKAFGAPEYLVASKDKKYSAWTTQTGLQYFYMNTKSMQGVIKPLKRIAKRYSNKMDDSRAGNLKDAKNKKDLELAIKAAKKLKGNQRKFVLTSLNQLKKAGTINNEGTNLLLFGIQ